MEALFKKRTSSLWSLLGGAALVAVVGCSDTQDPVSAADPETASAAKLTRSGGIAGGRPEHPQEPVVDGIGIPVVFEEELRLDQPLSLDNAEITWIDVQDSRCPEGAVCIWEGEVTVKLIVRPFLKRSQDRIHAVGPDTLTLGLSSRDEVMPRGEAGGYAVHLLDVSPYPVEGIETGRAAYAALVRLTPVPPPPPRRGGVAVSGGRAGGGPTVLPPGRPPEEPPFPPFPEAGNNKPLPPEVHRAFDEALGRWQALASSDYDYQYQRVCFCLPDYTRPMRVEVRDNAVAGATYADDGTPVAEQVLAEVPTVDGLFRRLRQALDLPAFSLRAAYDAQGLPHDVFIDYEALVADEELGFSASDLKIQQ